MSGLPFDDLDETEFLDSGAASQGFPPKALRGELNGTNG